MADEPVIPLVPADPPLPVDPAPVVVRVSSAAMFGMTGTGDGGDHHIETAAGRPNVLMKVMSPVTITAVRAIRVYLQTLIGLITAGVVAPTAIPAADFLHLVYLSAGLSVAPAGLCVLQNLLELFTKLEQKHPTLTA